MIGKWLGKGIKKAIGGYAGTILSIADELFEDAKESILDAYVVGKPPQLMDKSFVDKNNFDQWEIPWVFSEYLSGLQDYTNGIRVVFPVSFDTVGTHQLKFYTGYLLAPENWLLNTIPGTSIYIGNQAARRVGQVLSVKVEVGKVF